MSDLNQPLQNKNEKEQISTKRKLGYYFTLCLGGVFYIISIINFFGSVFGGENSYMYAVLAALITLLCPLWKKPFSQVLSQLREPSRKLTFYLLILSLIGLFIVNILDIKYAQLLLIGVIIFSGIWLSLSYYENGQETLLQFIKNCFGSNKGNNESNKTNNDNNSGNGDNNV